MGGSAFFFRERWSGLRRWNEIQVAYEWAAFQMKSRYIDKD
jgi:hypothetical protein